MATEDLTTPAGWDAFVRRHGGNVGMPYNVSPERIDNKRVQDPYYHYELGDGSTVEINSAGQVKMIDEKTPSRPISMPDQFVTVNDPRTGLPIAVMSPTTGSTISLPQGAAGWKDTRYVKNPDGSQTLWGFDPQGNFNQVPGAPTIPADPTGTANPKTVEHGGVVYERGDDGIYHPAQGIPSTPDKPETPVFKEVNGQVYQWITNASEPGGGHFALASGLDAGSHDPGYFIENGYKVYKTWNPATQKMEVDPSVKPEAWSPEAIAQANKTAAQPKEGDTRQNIESGYNVTQVYRGGEWTTTSIGSRAQPLTPATLQTSTDQPFIVRTDENGQPQTIANPNYQPKAATSRAEIAQRAANLQQLATQMRDKIATDASIPADQKADRFKQWWAANIAPQKTALDAGYSDVARVEAEDLAKQQQQAMQTAQTAGRDVTEAYAKTLPYRVGPKFDQTVAALAKSWSNPTAPPPDIDVSGAFTYKLPNMQDMYQNAVMHALKDISPTAAAMTGNQMQPMDLNGMLNVDAYQFGAPPGAAAAGGGGVPAAVPTGPTPDQLANQAAASAQTAAATAQAGMPFGAIDPRGMAALNPQAAAAAMPAYGGPGVPFSGAMPRLPGYPY